MKINFMSKRENFYSILDKTLSSYFSTTEKQGNAIFYVYPKLNAIVAKCPSNNVKKYLYEEYSLKGNFVKMVLAYLYTRVMLNSIGLFASKKIKIHFCGDAKMCHEYLIYPCNRKIRIFDFKSGTVDVIIKNSFSNISFKNEIIFRTAKRCPPFVPKILQYNDLFYKEEIIKGVPLARIDNKYDVYSLEALELLETYNKKNNMGKTVGEYTAEIILQIENLLSEIRERKGLNIKMCMDVLTRLSTEINKYARQEILMTFSHGDLQPGNIWIENGTEKIYIIDWESWNIRSIWYDRATFYMSIRKNGNVATILSMNEIELTNKLKINVKPFTKYIIALEDLLYRAKELEDLPFTYGTNIFNDYIYFNYYN